MCVYMCICMCLCVYVCIYTHTYIYIYIYQRRSQEFLRAGENNYPYQILIILANIQFHGKENPLRLQHFY